MAKKTNLLQDTQRSLQVVSDEEYQLEAQVPAIVQAWGLLVGIPSSERELLQGTYGGLGLRVARLLETCGVTEISEEALESVSKRWAKAVNPWVAVGARIAALHDSFREAPEDVPTAAERLWAVLEYRASAITGVEFKDVLK